MAHPGVRDLGFLHRFEQRRLRARRRAVDLVDQHQLREDRAGAELEAGRAAGRRHVDLAAGDIGGHQVGRALHARPLQPERGGQGLGQVRLAQPGQALDQHVAAGEDGRDQVADDVVLADDHAVEQRPQVLQLAVGVGPVFVGRRCGTQWRFAVAFIHART